MSRVLLVVYDNDSYIHWFPLGLSYIASALKSDGHEVVIYNKDQYHYPSEHLTEYLNHNKFDVVGLGVVAGYWQYQEMLRIAKAINASKQRPLFVLGGHGPSPEPEYFMKKTGADVIVIGEGEKAIQYVMSNLRRGFWKSPQIEDIDTISLPAWHLFPIDYYALLREQHICNADRCMPVITSRGCPFKCNFCYRMYEGIRLRSVEGIIEEIKILRKDYRINYISFIDELLMVSEKRAVEISEALMPLKIKWNCMGRLNYAKPEVIRTMKRAGCVFINYGIECLDDDILKVMNKNLTVEQITKGIEATLKEEVSPGFNIIFGNIGENEETLRKGVDFLLKYDDHSQLRTIRPVTSYPGSPLYYYAIERGLLKGPEDFYENKHKNSDLPCVNFTTLTDRKVKECLFDANKTLLEKYHKDKLTEQIDCFEKLYFENDTSFRGLRQT